MSLNENIKENIKNNKIKVFVILIVLVFAIIMILINKNKDENKVYNDKDYIYVSEIIDIGGIKSKLPHINLYGEEIDLINKDITTKYYTENLIGEKYMDYEYYKNANILSLIVKLYYLESNDFVPASIYFYNIDKNTGKILSNEELLNIYNVSELEIKNILLESIKEYYDYEIKMNYISNCDFNCYKEGIGSDILDNTSFYVKDNYLYAYKYFPIDRNLAYDDNAPFELFRFKIK